MIHALLPIFRLADQSWVAVLIRHSTWAFALVEVFHLFGLTLLLGTVVVVNLRLFGFGLGNHSLRVVAEEAFPFTLWGMLLTIGSGILLFVSEAMKCYASPPFFVKMGFLVCALVFTFTFHRHLTQVNVQPSPVSKFAASLSVALWFGVALAGRAIAFL
jgi:hypothetical protein